MQRVDSLQNGAYPLIYYIIRLALIKRSPDIKSLNRTA